jgi:hypothetical protein
MVSFEDEEFPLPIEAQTYLRLMRRTSLEREVVPSSLKVRVLP